MTKLDKDQLEEISGGTEEKTESIARSTYQPARSRPGHAQILPVVRPGEADTGVEDVTDD